MELLDSFPQLVDSLVEMVDRKQWSVLKIYSCAAWYV